MSKAGWEEEKEEGERGGEVLRRIPYNGKVGCSVGLNVKRFRKATSLWAKSWRWKLGLVPGFSPNFHAATAAFKREIGLTFSPSRIYECYYPSHLLLSYRSNPYDHDLTVNE